MNGRIWLAIGVLALSGVVAAQVEQEQVIAPVKQQLRQQPSLGAVAKATQKQRAKAAAAKAATEATSAGKGKAGAVTKATTAETDAAAPKQKYTNENLDGRPRPVAPTTYRAATARTTSMTRASGEGQDEAYWRRRAEPIRQQLEYHTDRLNLAKKRLEKLKADGGLDVSVANGKSSAIQGERERLTSYVQELEYQVSRYEQQMKTLEDEGRKAGALPGWFR